MSHLSTNISGNLTVDPNMKKVGDNKVVTQFRIASSRRRMTGELDNNGNPVWEDVDTLYIDVECWGQLALNTAASLRKGNPVLVEGKLVTDMWEAKVGQDNFGKAVTEPRSKIVMKANRIGFDMSNYQLTTRKSAVANIEPEEEASINDVLEQQARSAADAAGGVDERRVSAEDFASSPSFDDAAVDAAGSGDGDQLVGAGEGADAAPF